MVLWDHLCRGKSENIFITGPPLENLASVSHRANIRRRRAV